MSKCLLIALGLLAAASIVVAISGAEVGYEVAIKHIPKYSTYGYGIGQSVRYDKRIVPVYVPKKFIGEEIGLGYGGYGLGLGGPGDGIVGLGRGGLGPGGVVGLGGAGVFI